MSPFCAKYTETQNDHGYSRSIMTSEVDAGREAASEAPGARSRASELIRIRLLDAAVVIFGQQGFDAARVSDIARECNLTIGAIYSRWPSKREIFADAVEHASPRRYVHAVSASNISTLEKLAALAENLMKSGSTVYRDLMLEAAVLARRDESLREDLARAHDAEARSLSKIIEEGKAAGVIDPSLSTKSIILVCQSLGFGSHLALTADATGGRRPEIEEWNELIGRIIKAVAPPNGSESAPEGVAA